ncbi:hypothetical protein AB4Y45_33260 [Paraburkholderia sp. EG287A]|uniref:hypothetical protein n=1 Tax=Paraburkholderia sp. EG287A TaxID=3237012 RepID=UPI0034D352E5
MFEVLDGKALANLKSLKELNCHGDAYKEAAELLGLTALSERFERINREQLRLGSLTGRLQVERRAAYETLLDGARRLLSGEQYQRLYMCF